MGVYLDANLRDAQHPGVFESLNSHMSYDKIDRSGRRWRSRRMFGPDRRPRARLLLLGLLAVLLVVAFVLSRHPELAAALVDALFQQVDGWLSNPSDT